jgi:hypothetical protein
VLIYDDNGQHQGPSCADFLAGQDDVKVELMTPDRSAAADVGGMNYPIFMEHFYKKGVTVTPDHRLQSVQRSGNQLRATFSNEFGGPEIERIADHIVVEHGTLPLDELYFALCPFSANEGVTDIEALRSGRPQPAHGRAGATFELYRVGDVVSSRNVHAAIYDSLRLCKDL